MRIAAVLVGILLVAGMVLLRRDQPSQAELQPSPSAAGAVRGLADDSFHLAQEDRLARMTPARRMAKLAADSIRVAGNSALGRAGVDSALALWSEALRRYEAIADTAGIAAASGNVGAGLYSASLLDSAETFLVRAHLLATAIGDGRTGSNALTNLGNVSRDRGDRSSARSLYTKALELRERTGDAGGAAADHINLGLLSAEVGDLTGARAHYEDALARARQHGIPERQAEALINLGNAASADGKFAEAAGRYDEALSIYRASKSDVDAAFVLHNIGLLALRRGDFPMARARLTEALEVFEVAGTVEDLVLVRSDLALVLTSAGDLHGAMAELGRAEQSAAGAPDDAELAASVALTRGDIAAQLNTLPEAERHYARAESLYRHTRNARSEADAQVGRALLVAARRDHPRALDLLRAAQQAQSASGDRQAAALTLVAMGRVLYQQGELAAARRTLARAVDSMRALDDAVGEAEALSARGDLELAAGAAHDAEALYRRGISRVGRRTAPIAWELEAGLGRALRARGASDAAATALRTAIARIEQIAGTLALEERRASFLADKWGPYAELALVEHRQGNVAGAFLTSERMRARQMLDFLARGRVARGGSADSSLLERAQDLRRHIAELTRRLERQEGAAGTLRGAATAAPSFPTTRDALALAQREYGQLLLEMRESESAYGRIVRGDVAAWRDVANALAVDQALLEYLVSDSTTIVFVITRDTVRAVDLAVGRAAIEQRVDFVRHLLVRPHSSGSRPAGGAASNAAVGSPWRTAFRLLHRQLIAPIEATGALAGVRQLIVIPNAELHYLPFAALIRSGDPAGGGDEFLIERYDIGYAPSASVWLRLGAAPRRDNGGVLAVAPRPDALPGSRDEVEAIRKLYGREATVLMGNAVSEPSFRAAAPRHRIVHLATYGILNKSNPLFSFVSLNPGGGQDGRLEVHEVLGLSLDARLVVLSACQTALAAGAVSDVPAGDDWVGLARAFLSVGATNVIATLWPVEDRSTARVMERLYGRLRSGQPEISALAVAQRETLRDPTTADPFYWAGFVLVGGR